MFRTAAYYIIAAWVVLQVADLALPALGIPENAIRYVWIGAFLGFPLAMIFAWRYQITPEGIVLTLPQDADLATDISLNQADYVLLSTLALIAVIITLGLVGKIREFETNIPTAVSAPEILPNTVAVLPLSNLTGDPEQDYFVDGVHEMLIAVMAQVSALRVISRTSTDVYRRVARPLPEIASELRVANIVQGSVLQAGDKIRITFQLIDAKEDVHLWAKNYERDLKDIITLQSEVAREIAERIHVKLRPGEERRLSGTREVNPDTYRAYLRGLYHLNQFTPEGFQKGMAYLHDAVASDPGDPLAYAALARGYSIMGHSPIPPPDAWRRAKDAASKALLLNKDLPEAHTIMAEIRLYYDWDWTAAEESFKRAIELNPSQDWAHAHYGWYFHLMGDIDRAIEEMSKAQEIGPLMPLWSVWLAWLHWSENDLDKALVEAQKAMELNPNFPWGMRVLGGVYSAMGRHEEALEMHERLLPLMPNVANWGFADTYNMMGRREDALRVAAEVAENPGQKDLLALGKIYADLGNKTEALKWLEAAHEAHADWFPWIATGSGSELTRSLAILADEPRFQKLIADLKLPVKSPHY